MALRNWLPTRKCVPYRKLAAPASRRHAPRLLGVEALEDRSVPTSFSYPDFSSAARLTLVGGAAVNPSNQLRLTPAVSSTGGAWYTAEKPIVAGNFETTFQFKLATATGGSDGSDGFAFVIQNSGPTELRGGGGALGYDGMPNGVAVEFDTWLNNGVGDPWNDPSQSHISVHTNGTGANGANESFRIGSSYNTSGFILDDAQVHTARVRYTPGTLTVFLDNLTTPVLTVPLDLSTTLGLDVGRAWVGFTGAAGGAPLNQDVLNWSFTGDGNVVVANPASVIEGAAPDTSPLLFTIDRVGSTAGNLVVNWSTADVTANGGIDYVAASGQVVFLDGETQKTVPVTVNGDSTVESSETLRLILSTTTPGYAAASGLGTILTDDVTVSVGDASAIEGSVAMGPLGAPVSAGLGGMSSPYAMILGPDGRLYVSSFSNSAVYRYDASTGIPLPAPGKTGAEFVSPGSDGLNFARDLAFGPDGSLYVVSEGTDAVMRYDAATGAYLGHLVSPGSGGLDVPRGLVFNGGYAYVTSVGSASPGAGTDSVLRFDATTGSPAGVSGQPGDAVFIASGSGGLDNPSRIVFGPDGRAYVSSTAGVGASATTNSVLRYDGTTGTPAGISGQPGDAVFVSPGSGGLDGPLAMNFRPDGYLYVTSVRNNSVLRYQAATGASDGIVFSTSTLRDLLFEPSGNVLVTSVGTHEILRFGPKSQAAFTVSLSSASDLPVTVTYATANGTAAGSDYTATGGTITFTPGQISRTVLVTTLNDATAENPEAFTLTLSSPVGATITDGTGVATITDDDATKFFVVDDASANTTYRYGGPGNNLGSSVLNSGNTAPRGAASTAAGDKVWVVDANKKVYVYTAAGALLGSWTAGSLASNATVEGITVWGNDVWLVDAREDKVFKYAGGASRLSGSQNAASSFNLVTSIFQPYRNTSPKDLVTDGTSLWVVDDGSSDRVFKYAVGGSLLGSWAVGGGGSPTGITLDPTGASQDLWVVDNATDRVYQYAGARSLTTGSATVSATFALVAGNTNPQGIADPPAAGDMLLDSHTTQGRHRGQAALPLATNRFPEIYLAPDDFDFAPISVDRPRGHARRL